MVGPALTKKRGLRCLPAKTRGAEPHREAGPMGKLRFVGLDVHKETVVIAVAEADASAPQILGTFPNDITRLVKRLKTLGKGHELRCCYEAGPTGLGLHRALKDAGISCAVVAPSLIPKKAGDRVKTDRRDALKLARFLR